MQERAKADLNYLPVMDEATVAVNVNLKGLTKPKALRLYRQTDVLCEGMYNFEVSRYPDGVCQEYVYEPWIYSSYSFG